jgi:hypothetical protein
MPGAKVEEWSSRGKTLAKLLTGAWLDAAPPPDSTVEELKTVELLLLKSGAAALGWRRICNSNLHETQPAFQFRQAYRLYNLHAILRDRELADISGFLRSNGFDPLLGKGWAAAQLYPDPGLRPYTDFDFYFHPKEYKAAAVALRMSHAPKGALDLHCGVSELDDRGFDEVVRRSVLAPLGGSVVRVFGPEDHLRLLCLHMFHHGAWRPLWLCDVAVALDVRPENFDWEYFLSGDRRRSDWVACAIGLAHQLLGAEIDGTPVASRARRLPGWLVPTVLRQWGKGQIPHGARLPMINYIRRPSGIMDAVRIRWPNPIEATVGVHGPFNDFPRLPFQLAACLVRSAKLPQKLSAHFKTER